MAIRRIEILNFKSFDKLDIDLHGFNLLIGANASGKSNFVRIFDFLRDISNYSLEDAISMQGGVGYLRNITLGSQDFFIKITSDDVFNFGGYIRKDLGIKTSKITYRFDIKFNKRRIGYDIVNDELKINYDIFNLKPSKEKRAVLEDGDKIGEGNLSFIKNKTKVNYQIGYNEDLPFKEDDFIPPIFKKQKFSPKRLLMETIFFKIPFDVSRIFDISINDFDPKLPKRATPITGKIALEEDGSNLAIVIQNIIQHKESRRKFLNLVKDVLPFIAKLDIDKFSDKSVLIKLEEKYTKGKYLPASFVSDGTLNVVALIIALYFNRKRFAIIEEPERSIHPYLVSRIMNMMKDASAKKQLLVTTHNPEMVKHADLKDILFIARNKKGFSNISRPSEKESVNKFLENDIGIDEIFSKNLFGEE